MERVKKIYAENFKVLAEELGNLGRDVLWVCDMNTARMVRPLPEPNVILDIGDSSKSFESVQHILSTAVESYLTKSCTFLGLGGGTVQDLTGFAASIYMGGCTYIAVPTTLMAMADGPVDGVSSLNFMSGKNIIKTKFYPKEILICTDTLNSLKNFDYKNGLAEVIKYALVSKDSTLLDLLIEKKEEILRKDKDVLLQLIQSSIAIKEEVGDIDLGHTFGYPLESLLPNSFPHGSSVAWGIANALRAGLQAEKTNVDFANKVLLLLDDYGFDTNFKISRGQWQDYKHFLAKDSKRLIDNIKFIIPTDQGKYTHMDISEEIIKKIILQTAL